MFLKLRTQRILDFQKIYVIIKKRSVFQWHNNSGRALVVLFQGLDLELFK